MVWVCKSIIAFEAGTVGLLGCNPLEKFCNEKGDLDAKPAAASRGKAAAIDVESPGIIDVRISWMIEYFLY